MNRADLGTDQHLDSTSVTETFEASSFNALCPFHARGSIPSAGRRIAFGSLLKSLIIYTYSSSPHHLHQLLPIDSQAVLRPSLNFCISNQHLATVCALCYVTPRWTKADVVFSLA
ncbi:Peroxisomal membrane protein PER10 [Fusarium oxysporum f. sp. albedinis]|nr:Peroxisomal membrane protein PER10 [Fusarium oxysporum f. sp. albedinis]